MSIPLLSVTGLNISFKDQQVVNNLSFEIYPQQTFALVGESGSGKSLTALSVLRLLPPNAQVSFDSMRLQNLDLLELSERQFCKIRGGKIGFIFQDPMSCLNPVMTIGAQIAEVLTIHEKLSKLEIKQQVLILLKQVEIPEPERRSKEYPHQLSGGQRQRVMIAIALAGKPDLLIADEATTALDVTIQAQILELLKRLQQQTGMALWLISHDLALVSTLADTVAVMQQGVIVETAASHKLFKQPQHSYTKKLLAALPRLEPNLNDQQELSAKVLLSVQDFKVYYPIRKGILHRVVGQVRAVDGVNFELQVGKTLALVGESGCGKTTLGKALLNLILPHSGKVIFNNLDLNTLTGETLRLQRSEMQIIFQDPFAAMNPRMLISDIIAEGMLALHPNSTPESRIQTVRQLLRQVQLPENVMYRYPHEFSGGQRQRICIARTLAVQPKLIICDEPTSALDVSVQAQILELLKQLQQQQQISYLFISHDLAVVAEIADTVAVMYQGKIIEFGTVEQVLSNPQHEYTQKLLAAVPVIATT